jgi:hypothetical protein
MAPAQPFSTPHVNPPYPSLYLYPLNDTFIPKHISLHSGQRVKIGRQTNTKTIPGERNGYFDSKVLSRQHAEIWEDNGKVRRILCFSGDRLTDVSEDIHQRREKF